MCQCVNLQHIRLEIAKTNFNDYTKKGFVGLIQPYRPFVSIVAYIITFSHIITF
jgi:hypothetical protein